MLSTSEFSVDPKNSILQLMILQLQLHAKLDNLLMLGSYCTCIIKQQKTGPVPKSVHRQINYTNMH